MENEQQDDNVDANGDNGNGNGKGNGNPNAKNRDSIQGNMIAAEPVRLQDAIRIANNLIDQNLKGYAIKNAKNKRRFDNNSRDNRGQQQQPFKRQIINGQNVARAYTVGNNVERRGDCRIVVVATPQRAPGGNQTGNAYYECERQGHYRNECPKLRNQNRGNKTGNKTGNNEAKARAYEIREGGDNPDLNVVTCTFLLNNRYASMLFDSGVDRSFVSTTFGAFLDVIPSTLGTSYAIELADRRISETNVILRVIVCAEKIIRIPYGDEVLIIKGDVCNGESKSKLSIISCTKTHKYIQKSCPVYLAQVTSKKADDESEEKRLEDVLIVQDFPEVFPEDLPGLPPTRQVEF
ncbi:putative reverse transcriptase domain-containing protein [Tanacetum coccineum]